MLLRFSVSNNLSIRDEQELSLVASSLKDEKAVLRQSEGLPGTSILPCAVIYGANASGKSNLVASMLVFRDMVTHSHSRGEAGDRIGRTPFALDEGCSEKPTATALDFIVGDVRYYYGFEFTDDEIVEEWLFQYPHGRRQLLFEREGMNFRFGRKLGGQNSVISKLTRPNSLFLSAALQNRHRLLSTVAEYIRDIQIDTAISTPGGLVYRRLFGYDVDDRAIKILETLGTGVVGYRNKEEKIPKLEIDYLSVIFDAANKKDIKVNLPESGMRQTVELAHSDSRGKKVYLDLSRESAGTRRLLMLLSRIYEAIDSGSPMVIDELDASLHTQACEAILAMFASDKMNPKGAQLIATTHDSNLLGCSLLRRDQIWFAEKDQGGATHLYPLTDIRTRKGDDLKKGYLQGRFGAVPFSGDPSSFIESL